MMPHFAGFPELVTALTPPQAIFGTPKLSACLLLQQLAQQSLLCAGASPVLLHGCGHTSITALTANGWFSETALYGQDMHLTPHNKLGT